MKRKARNDEVFNWIDVSEMTRESLVNYVSGLMTYVFLSMLTSDQAVLHPFGRSQTFSLCRKKRTPDGWF